MRIVFFGTPYYTVPILDKLHKTFRSGSGESPVVAVVTQPPKPAGRKQFKQYSPADTWAYQRKIPVYFDPQDLMKKKVKADVGILASYGSIIPEKVINLFLHGVLNIHPSLLPKWRGSSPVQASLISGEKETGVSIIKLDEKLDHGPIVSQFKEEILPDDTTASLRIRMFEKSADVLTTLLPAYINGKIKPREQDHAKATFTSEIKKEDSYVDPEALQAALQGKGIKKKWVVRFMKEFTNHYSPITIHEFIRAMQPWPVAWTGIRLSKDKETKRLRLLKSHEDNQTNIRLVLDLVQLEGKNPVSWQQFTTAYPKAKFV